LSAAFGVDHLAENQVKIDPLLQRYTEFMTAKLRPIRTHRRDASVTRREVSSAIRDVTAAQDAHRPTRATAKDARTEAVSANVAGRYLGLVRRATSLKPAGTKGKRKTEGIRRPADEPVKK
jgi:hypothetical protein